TPDRLARWSERRAGLEFFEYSGDVVRRGTDPVRNTRLQQEDQLGVHARAPRSFGEMLRGFRTRAGLSREALAERAGVGVATLKALERDERQRPHPHTLAALASALELPPAELDALLGNTHVSETAAESTRTPASAVLPEQPGEASKGPLLPLWLTSFVG